MFLLLLAALPLTLTSCAWGDDADNTRAFVGTNGDGDLVVRPAAGQRVLVNGIDVLQATMHARLTHDLLCNSDPAPRAPRQLIPTNGATDFEYFEIPGRGCALCVCVCDVRVGMLGCARIVWAWHCATTPMHSIERTSRCSNARCTQQNDPSCLGPQVVLPKVTGVLEHVYDPMSGRQTAAARAVVQQLFEFSTVSTGRDRTRAMLNGIANRLLRAAQVIPQLPSFQAQALADPASGASEFVELSINRCLKLLEAVVQWDGLVLQHSLLQIALDKIITARLIKWLKAQPAAPQLMGLCEQIAMRLPPAWFQSQPNHRPQKQFQPLISAVSQLGARLNQVYPTGGFAETAGKLTQYFRTGQV
eukprot:m.278335 g.278335  ORF g.278335 m.278335 type:complete len:361 (-) comp19381_c0_seq1:78-1160(-)